MSEDKTNSYTKVISPEVKIKNNISLKKRVLKKVGKISLNLLSAVLIIGSTGASAGAVDASEAAKEVLASEGGKEALNQALKFSRSRPSLAIATTITCMACIPVAGVTASASMCVACGILVAKTLG